MSQLVASPVLGDLSDRWGRRPVLIFSLLGTVVSFVMLAVAHSLAMLFAARIVDGLSGGNITTARAYIADITTEENRAKAFGMLGAAFGLGLHRRARRSAALFSHISYTAPIWAAAAITVVATAARVVLAARDRPPRARRRAARRGARSADWAAAATCGCSSRSTSSTGRRSRSTRRRSRCSARGASASTRRTPAICSSAFGFLGVLVQGGLVGPIVAALGERRTLTIGLAVRGGRLGRQRDDAFAAGLHRDARAGRARHRPVQRDAERRWSASAAGPHEQGRVQGAAGALESLGRTLGPVWGNGALQWFGEGAAYGSAALVLIGAAALTMAYRTAGAPTLQTRRTW